MYFPPVITVLPSLLLNKVPRKKRLKTTRGSLCNRRKQREMKIQKQLEANIWTSNPSFHMNTFARPIH